MPDDKNPEETKKPEGGQNVLRLRYDKTNTAYANLAVVTTTPEEVIMNFGVNAMPPSQQKEINIEISDRVIMTYSSAKRLAITLGNIIQRFEQSHGVINLGTPQAAAGPPAGDAKATDA